jgi:hypothetical protein
MMLASCQVRNLPPMQDAEPDNQALSTRPAGALPLRAYLLPSLLEAAGCRPVNTSVQNQRFGSGR